VLSASSGAPLFWSRVAWIGTKKSHLNSAWVPSSPGLRNSISGYHRSPMLFRAPVSAMGALHHAAKRLSSKRASASDPLQCVLIK
jgi:hypothetical protein